MTDLVALYRTLDDLNDELAEIDERRAAIRGQIEQAQAERRVTGRYADADWFRRAKGADRHLGVERAEVCRRIGETNRAIKAANRVDNERRFERAVREVVDEATMRLIYAKREQLRAEEADHA